MRYASRQPRNNSLGHDDNLPYVRTETRTVTYSRENGNAEDNLPGSDQMITSQTHSTRSYMMETTTVGGGARWSLKFAMR